MAEPLLLLSNSWSEIEIVARDRMTIFLIERSPIHSYFNTQEKLKVTFLQYPNNSDIQRPKEKSQSSRNSTTIKQLTPAKQSLVKFITSDLLNCLSAAAYKFQQFGNVSNENEIAFCVRLSNLTGLLIIGSINASRNAFKAIEKFMFISWLTIK